MFIVKISGFQHQMLEYGYHSSNPLFSSQCFDTGIQEPASRAGSFKLL
ncbi:hypothetical protein [Wolbachia endosymbiont of Tribolium confusum]|nr:hypothetical protein [Wolbachia endosymbiont of Tribolium confusum]MCA7010004.1 hypothetical protein [Wolbachia endosymbiont of Tribolium confusum]